MNDLENMPWGQLLYMVSEDYEGYVEPELIRHELFRRLALVDELKAKVSELEAYAEIKKIRIKWKKIK